MSVAEEPFIVAALYERRARLEIKRRPEFTDLRYRPALHSPDGTRK